jgi:2-(1,2-epoxy-1,2-dihydrophenyl)acetyl-CoA isomerase
MPETVTREDSAGVATLTMLRPGLSSASRRELLGLVREVAVDESVRAVLLTGTGRAFCVGQDLNESRARREATAGPAETELPHDLDQPLPVLVEEYNPLVLALSGLRVPLVVGMNGACAGAGLGLALTGDLRVAAAGAKITTAFAGVALSSDSGVASRLVHCVGGARAAELLLLPEPFLAETALQWGLVHRVVPPGQVGHEAWALAARLAAGPTVAYRAIKTVLATAATDSLEETLALEARLQTRAGQAADHREAVEAFLAKRPPVFTGH